MTMNQKDKDLFLETALLAAKSASKIILESNKNSREHVVKIVGKSENHPVRFGKQ